MTPSNIKLTMHVILILFCCEVTRLCKSTTQLCPTDSMTAASLLVM